MAMLTRLKRPWTNDPSDLQLRWRRVGQWHSMMSHPFGTKIFRLNLLRLPDLLWPVVSDQLLLKNFQSLIFCRFSPQLSCFFRWLLGSLHGWNQPLVGIPHHVILQEEPKHSRSDEDRQDAGDPQKDRSSRNPGKDGCGAGEINGLGDRLPTKWTYPKRHLCVTVPQPVIKEIKVGFF